MCTSSDFIIYTQTLVEGLAAAEISDKNRDQLSIKKSATIGT